MIIYAAYGYWLVISTIHSQTHSSAIRNLLLLLLLSAGVGVVGIADLLHYLHHQSIEKVRAIAPSHISVIEYDNAINERSLVRAEKAVEYTYEASPEEKFKLKWVASQLTLEYRARIELLLTSKFVSSKEINDLYDSFSKEELEQLFTTSMFNE